MPHNIVRPTPPLRIIRRETQKVEDSDTNLLADIRGYAPLSHDATTKNELDWQQLGHESKQEPVGHSHGPKTPGTHIPYTQKGLPKERHRKDQEVEDDSTDSTSDDISDSASSGSSTPDITKSDRPEAVYENSTPNAEQYLSRKRRIVFESPPISKRRLHAYPSPVPRPRRSEYFQQKGNSAYVESDSSNEESQPSASKTPPKARSAKQRKTTAMRRTPSDTVLTRTKQGDSTLGDVLDELKNLRTENERLRQAACGISTPSQPVMLAYTSKVFYKVGKTMYLDEPHWEPAEGSGVVLLANNPIRKMEYYLDQHPEIAFATYKEYREAPPADCSKIETKDGVYRSPKPTHEYLSLIAPDMIEAVEEFVQAIPQFSDYFPYFNPRRNIVAPYFFMYYSTPFLHEVVPKLRIPNQNLIKQLHAVIQDSYGGEYHSARLQADKGMVTSKHLKYLIRPGDVLVSNGLAGDVPQACIVTGWIKDPEKMLSKSQYEESDHIQSKLISRYGPLVNPGSSRKLNTWVWEVPVWYWKFDGTYAKHETRVNVVMSLGYEEESVEIRNLNNYPLQYADKEMRLLLEKRGRTFWSLRDRRFVSYLRSDEDELHSVEDRYMVDTKAYKMLFPNSKIARLQPRNGLSATIMARDEPPEEGNALLVAPSTIMAHNLQEKQWRELLVDRITDIVWNKQAFEDLVAEPETKELVQALVMKRINAKKSTDFVAGKGNGLIMLLHGAPGTGKTFTAEGVAEFAEKPLLRVTCGDVGTDAEIVDQRLRATFQLGRLWDCVVLLDEADVFLEERDMKDLKRNALVSVFLRALEYYDGILILTSNRVGTFDEAFKSRIQLALHYENLGVIQRRKIWRNFIERMRTLEEYSDRDLDDILDHIEELGREPMNGREIRNVITIARQLAQFRGPQERFGYSHLEHAIKVASRFSRYLKDMRMDLTDDMIKQDNGIRFSYTVVPAGLE